MKTINFIKNPVAVKEDDWLFQNLGRISVATESNDEGFVYIIAYSDDKSDSRELNKIAQEHNGYIIQNVSEKGVDYVDQFEY